MDKVLDKTGPLPCKEIDLHTIQILSNPVWTALINTGLIFFKRYEGMIDFEDRKCLKSVGFVKDLLPFDNSENISLT